MRNLGVPGEEMPRTPITALHFFLLDRLAMSLKRNTNFVGLLFLHMAFFIAGTVPALFQISE